MRVVFLFLFSAFAMGLCAQQITRFHVGSLGAIFSSDQISATVGQTAASTLSQSGTILTQGFEQPDDTEIEIPVAVVDLQFGSCADPEGSALISISNLTCNGEEPVLSYLGVPLENGGLVVEVNQIVTILAEYNTPVCNQGFSIDTEYPADIPDCPLFVPNAISPNGDMINDTWSWRNPEEEIKKVQIYSKWGELVWESSFLDEQNAWDGKDANGNDLPVGVYFYIIEGSTSLLQGSITLTK